MKYVIIIPDTHGRTFWKDAVDKYGENAEKIVFLGDYLDSYPDENITRKDAIRNFEEIINFKLNNPEKVVMLIGNHDAHYAIDRFIRSTRYDSHHAFKIKEMFLSHRSLFKLAHEETINDKRILFTHAGLMNSWFERNKKYITDTSASSLNRLLETPGGTLALSEISKYRTWLGEKSGSIVWSDVKEKIDDKSEINNIIPNEDSIVDGYDYQIFGHTQLTEKPIITDKWACLDCRKAFILNDEGRLIET